jgi:NhaA family Na+:H+ antiporter
LTREHADLSRGWAIPAATDIAFALGLLALLGKRAPTSLKLFLTTVAIVDDVGAVAIIALFYTAALNWLALGLALLVFGGMVTMNRMGVVRVRWYAIGFALLWYAMLLSGVHATVAGVLAAVAVPVTRTPGAPDVSMRAGGAPGGRESPLHRLEHGLQPWVAFAIVPLFGFANAGVALGGAAAAFASLPLGIALGLFLGKQAGVFGAVWLAAKTGVAVRPAGASWAQVYGVALLCGIGFTMSLFIGGLAFAAAEQADAVKIGVLMGSVASALAGCAVLYFTGAKNAGRSK